MASWAPPPVVTRTLQNGMQVLVVERHDHPLVSLRYVSRAATRFYGGTPGIAELTADALRHGTVMADGRESVGLQIAGQRPWTYASKTGTRVGIDVLQLAYPLAVEVLGRMVRHPSLGPDAVRQALHSQHARLYDSSNRLDGIAASLKMGMLYGDDHPWATDERATQKALYDLTPEALRRFHGETFVPDASALVVVGDVEASEVFALAERAFGDWAASGRGPAPNRLPRQQQDRHVRALLAGGRQSHVLFAWPVPAIDKHGYHAYELLAQIIGGQFRSRASVALRHHAGSTYGVSARITSYPGGGHLELQTTVYNRELGSSVRAIRNEIARVRDEGITHEELDAARAGYLSLFDLTTNSRTADTLDWLFGQGLDPDWLRSLQTAVQAVDAHQVQEAARGLDPEHCSVIVVGDYTRTHRSLARLGELELFQIEDD
jgi:predicted Zn-dependent peptidase